jgi:uncharacterized membrane protein
VKTSWIFIFCTLYSLFNASAALIIKHKLLTHKINQAYDFFFFLIDPKIAFAFVLILVSMFFSMKALSISDFSFVIPVSTSINFILTVLIGILFFKDNMVLGSYIGIAFILVGITLLAKSYGR